MSLVKSRSGPCRLLAQPGVLFNADVAFECKLICRRRPAWEVLTPLRHGVAGGFLPAVGISYGLGRGPPAAPPCRQHSLPVPGSVAHEKIPRAEPETQTRSESGPAGLCIRLRQAQQDEAVIACRRELVRPRASGAAPAARDIAQLLDLCWSHIYLA